MSWTGEHTWERIKNPAEQAEERGQRKTWPTPVAPPPMKDSYWCVAVHVPAAADGRGQAAQVDGRQTLL